MQKLAFIFMAAHLIANVLCEWSSLSHSQKYLQAIEEGKHDKYIGAKGIRHFLQTLGLYSVDENVQEKIAASLSKFLRENDGVETEIEAVYALSIFADGSLERAQMVVNTGVVPNLIKILHLSDDDKLVWVTLMVFANLMKGHPNQRDYCINQGLVPILIKIGFETSESAVRNGVAVTMYSICQDRPDIPIDIIAKLLPSLKDFMKYEDEIYLIDNTLSTLAFITKKGNDHVQFLLDFEMTKDLIKFLGYSSSRIQFWAFSALENMAKGTDEQFEHLMNTDILSHIEPLLMNSKNEDLEVSKEVLHFILDIFERDNSQLQDVIDEGLIEAVIKKFEDHDTQESSVAVLMGIAIYATPKQLAYFIHQTNIVEVICNQLNDPLLMEEAMELITTILETNEKEFIVQRLNECGALEILNNLKGHDKHYTRKLAHKIRKHIASSRIDKFEHDDL